jgi:hypothetical protein
MNRLNLTTICILLLIAACKKQNSRETNGLASDPSVQNKTSAIAVCQPPIFSLTVDSSTGDSYIFKISGSPGAGPITVSPYVVSGTSQLKTCGGAPIKWATGLAMDPATGIFYGTTGAASPTPNRFFRFTDPNCAVVGAASPTCAISLDLSDLERDPATNTFYAINRGTAAPNNRIVKTGLPGGLGVTCLPNTLPVGLRARGLTFDCSNKLYVMHTAGMSGTVVFVDKVTGAIGSVYSYPGPIANSPAVATPEIGLHFDCRCIKQFITASWSPFTMPSLMTDGLPSGLGGPIYNSATGALKPTVDFARPY